MATLNSFSNSMISSTVSSESAPKSFVNDASGFTSLSSTPNFSTIIAFTLEAISDIVSIFYMVINYLQRKIKSDKYQTFLFLVKNDQHHIPNGYCFVPSWRFQQSF